MIDMPVPKDRNLYLCSDINQSSINSLVVDILDIERSDVELAYHYDTAGIVYKPKPINLYIDSNGGECYASNGLISVIELCSTPVRTIVTGCAMSCAFIIAVAGHERIAYPNSTLMHHGVSVALSGNVDSIKMDLSECSRLQKLGDNLILKRTKITREQLRKNNETKTDWYMTPAQALKLGVIDGIAKRNIL